MKLYRLVIITLFLFIISVGKTAVTAQSPIIFSDENTENNFPNNLTFTINAAAAEGEIVSAKFYYIVRNGVSTTQEQIDITSAAQQELTYVWDTADITVVPSTAVFYHWELTDSAGNRVKSDEQIVYYDDIRYDWQVFENDDIAVWQHDREKKLGESVFAIAERAIEQQKELFQTDLDYQIRIILYNDFDEFAAWHGYVNEFIGGQAFPTQGITTQNVESYSALDRWLNDVIPHEISHLYLYQASSHPLSNVPAWLNEGIAQYNEFSANDYMLDYVRETAQSGDLLRLYSLGGNFGNDEYTVRLSYAESLSAATYLVETYGEEGLKKLLAAYKSGKSDDEALMEGLDVSLITFEQGWLAWLDAPDGLYPTPTAVATLVPVPTAAMMMPPTRQPTAEATVTEVETEMESVEVTAVSVPSPVPAAVPSPAPSPSPVPPVPKSNGICATAVLPLLVFGLVWKRPRG